MTTLLKPIELAINLALSQDPETTSKLEQFDQRSIKIEIRDIKSIIKLEIVAQKITLSTDSDKPADLTLASNAIPLIKLGKNPESLFSSDIDIHGDIQFAKQLQEVLTGFDFDWEAQLAKLTGDTLAFPIAHAIRQTTSWLNNTHDSLQLSTAEYLKEEVRILPDKSQVKEFISNTDELRADLDRLEARIKRLTS